MVLTSCVRYAYSTDVFVRQKGISMTRANAKDAALEVRNLGTVHVYRRDQATYLGLPSKSQAVVRALLDSSSTGIDFHLDRDGRLLVNGRRVNRCPVSRRDKPVVFYDPNTEKVGQHGVVPRRKK
jgi:hypothetical protein